jgi:hypothetical protein
MRRGSPNVSDLVNNATIHANSALKRRLHGLKTNAWWMNILHACSYFASLLGQESHLTAYLRLDESPTWGCWDQCAETLSTFHPSSLTTRSKNSWGSVTLVLRSNVF